jgi:prolipoprotein diacylglyceryl transferase
MAYIHFASPTDVAFYLFNIPVYFYGICLAIGILFGFYFSYSIMQKYYKNLDKETLYDVFLVCLIFGFLSARLYYCLLSSEYYVNNLSDILNFRQGGLSIQGGIIGGFLSGIIYAKIKKLSVLVYADIISYGLVIAQSIGRWGNFFNSEAYGLPAKYIGVFIPTANRIKGFENIEYFQPTFLYESILDFCIFLILFFVIRKINNRFDGLIFASYIILYSSIRFFMEFLRLDSVYNIFGIHIAQIVCIIMIICAASFIIYSYKYKNSNIEI